MSDKTPSRGPDSRFFRALDRSALAINQAAAGAGVTGLIGFLGLTLVAALKKLAADNLANLTPHPFYVFMTYSHPPMIERLAALEKHPQA